VDFVTSLSINYREPKRASSRDTGRIQRVAKPEVRDVAPPTANDKSPFTSAHSKVALYLL